MTFGALIAAAIATLLAIDVVAGLIWIGVHIIQGISG